MAALIGDRELLDRARQLRARDRRRRRGRRRPPAALRSAAPAGHEPRRAADRRRGHLAGPPARTRRRDVSCSCPERRRPVHDSSSADDARCGRSARSAPACDGLPLAIELAAARTRAFPAQQILARAERSVPVAHRRLAHGAAAPADPAGRRRLELRPAVRRRATGVRAPVGVPGRLRSGDGRGGLRRRRSSVPSRSPTSSRRSSTSRSSTPLPAGDRRALHPAADAGPVRPGEAGRAWRGRSGSATPWRRTSPSCAPQSAAAYIGDDQRAVADRRRPGAGQPRVRARVGGRQRRCRDGVDDRRWRQLAALAGRHRGRGQALARRRPSRCAGEVSDARTGLGADWTGPDQLPARRRRGRRRRLRSGPRRVPPTTATRRRWPSRTRSTPRSPRREATSRRPAAADATCCGFYESLPDEPVRRRRARLLVGEARGPRRRPRHGRALLPGRRRRVRRVSTGR